MTVAVMLCDGETDKYMRFGDTYVKHHNGTLDVLRVAPNGRTGKRRGMDRRRRRPKALEEEPFLGLNRGGQDRPRLPGRQSNWPQCRCWAAPAMASRCPESGP